MLHLLDGQGWRPEDWPPAPHPSALCHHPCTTSNSVPLVRALSGSGLALLLLPVALLLYGIDFKGR